MFSVIPAIDLKDGIVVHGKGGHRDQYQPIESALCASANAFDVVTGLRSLYRFDVIYIADLDAIARTGSHSEMIIKLLDHWPDLQIWCDFGLRDAQDYDRFPVNSRLRAIAGTETLGGCESLIQLRAAKRAEPVLSLDYKAGKPLGTDEILAAPTLWPTDVIVLSLDHVGSSSGPPLSQLEEATARKQQAGADINLFAGGGVRDSNDLIQLRDGGYAGAVVATALHRGAIGSDVLQKLQT